MWPYLVAYELADGAGHEHQVIARLNELQGRRLMNGLWLVVVDEGAAHIMQSLSPCLSPSDRILVLELAEDRASWNVTPLWS